MLDSDHNEYTGPLLHLTEARHSFARNTRTRHANTTIAPALAVLQPLPRPSPLSSRCLTLLPVQVTTGTTGLDIYIYIIGSCARLPQVPFAIVVGMLSLRATRRQNRKVGRVNDRAAAGTIEVLRELSTVRQFGMERAEVAKYFETATWRMQLERRLKVSAMITRYYR